MKRSLPVLVVAVLCLTGLTGLTGLSAVSGASGSVQRGFGTGAGVAGTPITLVSQHGIYGYDIAMGADGTAYVGWISNISGADRTVHSCVLPKNATACLGGVQSTPSLDGATATALHVLPPSGAFPARLVWYHDTANSINGPLNAKIAVANLQSNGALSAGVDLADAPSFGSLLTVELGPGGAIWVVERPLDLGSMRVLPGLAGTPKVFNPSWTVGNAHLAFTNGKAVLVADTFGAIGTPVHVVHQTATGWSSFQNVAGTWSVGGAYDVVTRGTVRLVASINNATYHPRIGTWNGSSFGSFVSTGDMNSCAPESHDLLTDASGRITDVAMECGKVTIGNQPQARTGAFVRFGVGGSGVAAGGEPQIGATPRGLGWVAWSRQSPVENSLFVAPIRLPALLTLHSASSTFGTVHVKGPVSCLPAVQTSIGVTASGKNGWSVVGKTLKLDGAVHGTGLNGAGLAAGSTHTVAGTATFAKSGQHRTLTATLSFKACPNP